MRNETSFTWISRRQKKAESSGDYPAPLPGCNQIEALWPHCVEKRYPFRVTESTPAPASPSTADRAPRAAILTVFLVVFIDLLGFGIVLPLLPRVADDYLTGYGPAERGMILGALYSSFSVMQFLFSPVWGRLSDRIGRRPVLLISLTGSVLFYGLFAIASTIDSAQSTLALALLMISRIGAGIAGASVSTAAAVIADCTPKETRSKSMALIGVAFGFGFTLGPLIAYAGLELFQGQRWGVGAVASALSLVALAIAFALFRETRTGTGGETTAKELFSLSKTMDVVRSPAVGPLVLTYFLAIFSFAIFEGTLSLFTKAVFDLGERPNFLIFAYIGFVLMLAQGGLYRRLAGKVADPKLLAFGVIMMIAGLGGVGGVALAAHLMTGSVDAITGLKPAFFLTTAIAVCGFAFVNPSITSLVSKRADPARQGEVQGVNQSFASLGRILGPFIGLFLFEQDVRRIAPYALAVVALGLVIVLLPLVSRKQDA
jgi:DHA1 family tetracycline resistance protein-like MFS transporter